jgi:four helix bundle protein
MVPWLRHPTVVFGAVETGVFNFERLEVWQEAVRRAETVYTVTVSFPTEERFGLTLQMRRAAVSISSNIAEGCSRSSSAGYSHFVEIAAGSTFEIVSQARIAHSLGYLADEDYRSIYHTAEKLGRMLSGLRKSLQPDSR